MHTKIRKIYRKNQKKKRAINRDKSKNRCQIGRVVRVPSRVWDVVKKQKKKQNNLKNQPNPEKETL